MPTSAPVEPTAPTRHSTRASICHPHGCGRALPAWTAAVAEELQRRPYCPEPRLAADPPCRQPVEWTRRRRASLQILGALFTNIGSQPRASSACKRCSGELLSPVLGCLGRQVFIFHNDLDDLVGVVLKRWRV